MPAREKLPERNEALLAIRRRVTAARRQLWTCPDVVGVGIGYREKGGEPTSQPCVIVHVAQKRKQVAKHRRLPATCQGLRVDVQERGALKFCTAAHGGMLVRRVGREERGRAGLVVRDGATDRPHLLTAMHVLSRDRVGQTYGVDDDIRVEMGAEDDDFAAVGSLVDGALTQRRDIACIALDADANSNAGHGGSGRELQQPLAPDRLRSRQAVFLALSDGTTDRTGTFHSRDYDALFKLDNGHLARFRGLLSFRLRAKKGWSGSVIFDDDLRPIALLSFADIRGSSGLCFGWPLHGYYTARGLKPL